MAVAFKKSAVGFGVVILVIGAAVAVYLFSRPHPRSGNALSPTAAMHSASRQPLIVDKSDSAIPIDARPTQSEIPDNSSPELKISQIGPNHYKVECTQQIATGGLYPLLKFTNLKGKTVTIDLCGEPFDHWKNAIPQYGYVTNLSDLKNFESPVSPTTQSSDKAADYAGRPRTGDWAALPDTSGQSWHFFKHIRRDTGVLSVTQTFTESTAYISDRVPYTPEYNQNYLVALGNNPYVEVVELGKSAEGRPLNLVKTRGTPEEERKKPCVLIYAREHCDEQDASWAARGAIDFLASDEPEARSVREECTFLVIPLFDPDGANAGVHANILDSFLSDVETPETITYAGWFKKWVDDGRRLDVAFPLHNPPPSAAFHVACPIMEPKPDRLAVTKQLHDRVRGALLSEGFTVRNTPWTTGLATPRLTGWLSTCFGVLPLAYEINSLTPKRELNLREVRQIGRIIVNSAADFFSDADGKSFLSSVDQIRSERIGAWSALAGASKIEDPIQAELQVATQLRASTSNAVPSSMPSTENKSGS